MNQRRKDVVDEAVEAVEAAKPLDVAIVAGQGATTIAQLTLDVGAALLAVDELAEKSPRIRALLSRTAAAASAEARLDEERRRSGELLDANAQLTRDFETERGTRIRFHNDLRAELGLAGDGPVHWDTMLSEVRRLREFAAGFEATSRSASGDHISGRVGRGLVEASAAAADAAELSRFEDLYDEVVEWRAAAIRLGVRAEGIEQGFLTDANPATPAALLNVIEERHRRLMSALGVPDDDITQELATIQAAADDSLNLRHSSVFDVLVRRVQTMRTALERRVAELCDKLDDVFADIEAEWQLKLLSALGIPDAELERERDRIIENTEAEFEDWSVFEVLVGRVRILQREYEARGDALKMADSARNVLERELADARDAVGAAWLRAGDAILADAIRAKCAALEGIGPASAEELDDDDDADLVECDECSATMRLADVHCPVCFTSAAPVPVPVPVPPPVAGDEADDAPAARSTRSELLAGQIEDLVARRIEGAALRLDRVELQAEFDCTPQLIGRAVSAVSRFDVERGIGDDGTYYTFRRAEPGPDAAAAAELAETASRVEWGRWRDAEQLEALPIRVLSRVRPYLESVWAAGPPGVRGLMCMLLVHLACESDATGEVAGEAADWAELLAVTPSDIGFALGQLDRMDSGFVTIEQKAIPPAVPRTTYLVRLNPARDWVTYADALPASSRPATMERA